MNILFIGSASTLSLVPFRALVESKYNVCAFAYDESLENNINVINSGSIQSFAFEQSIPLIKIDPNFTKSVVEMNSYHPDIIFVSCYSRLLPPSIYSLAKFGCFNIHPSILPHYRGPTPIFWQFRDGISDFGISLHHVSEDFDTGDIVAQKNINIEDGVNQQETKKQLAKIASDLVFQLLLDIETDSVNKISQTNKVSSYQSYPDKTHYSVNTTWEAKRIYNFINAYKEKGIVFLCEINNKEFKILEASSYQQLPYDNMQGRNVLLEGERIWFECESSYIECEVLIAN